MYTIEAKYVLCILYLCWNKHYPLYFCLPKYVLETNICRKSWRESFFSEYIHNC